MIGEMIMSINVQSVLVKYFTELQRDPDVPYPEELAEMQQSGIDFEVSKLYEYILTTTTCRDPFLMDVPEYELVRLLDSEDDNIRISAVLSIMSTRLPQLQLKSRV